MGKSCCDICIGGKRFSFYPTENLYVEKVNKCDVLITKEHLINQSKHTYTVRTKYLNSFNTSSKFIKEFNKQKRIAIKNNVEYQKDLKILNNPILPKTKRLTLNHIKKNKLSAIDLVKHFNPTWSDEQCDFHLWENTCFPFSIESVVTQLNQQFLKTNK